MGKIRDFFLGAKPQGLKLTSDVVLNRVTMPKAPQLDVSLLSLEKYATKSELVYACIEKKAQAACDPELIIQKKNSQNEWEKVEQHPALDVLLNPNPWDDGESFVRAWIASENVSDMFFAEIVRSGAGQPVQLYPLHPAYIVPQYKHSPYGDVLDYYSYYFSGFEVKLKPEELLIRRRHGLGSVYTSIPPLLVALNSIDADIAAVEYVRAFFNNGGAPSGIIYVEGKQLTDEEANAMQQRWMSKYGRYGTNRGGVTVMDKTRGSYEAVGAKLSDLNSETLTSIDETRICMAFGVPPVIIGTYVGLKNVNQKASFKGAMEEFWMNTMSPELKSIRKFLTRKFLPLFGEEKAVMRDELRFWWDMSTVEALQDDVDSIHKRAENDFKAGIITRNEARETLNLKPVDGELGDEFFKAPAPIGPGDGSQPVPPKMLTIEDDSKTLGQLLKLTNGNGQKKTFEYEGLTLGREPTETEKKLDLKGMVESRRIEQQNLANTLINFRKDLIREASQSIKEHGQSDIFELTLTPPDTAQTRIRKHIDNCFRIGRNEVADDLRRQGKKDIPGWEEFLKTIVDSTVSRIVNEIQTRAINIFTALGLLGLDEGEIADRLKRDLEDQSTKAFEDYASQAVNSAINAGRDAEAEIRSDEWQTVEYSAILDVNTCDPCAEADGQQSTDVNDLPDAPNPDCEGGARCRCFHVYIYEEQNA